MLSVSQLRELIDDPKELRMQQVETILYNYGYCLANSKGSHFHFKKKNFPSITVVSHSKKVKKWYIKRLAKILLSHLPT